MLHLIGKDRQVAMPSCKGGWEIAASRGHWFCGKEEGRMDTGKAARRVSSSFSEGRGCLQRLPNPFLHSSLSSDGLNHKA